MKSSVLFSNSFHMTVTIWYVYSLLRSQIISNFHLSIVTCVSLFVEWSEYTEQTQTQKLLIQT